MKKNQFSLRGDKCFYSHKLFLIMKLTIFLLLISLVSIAATGYSQADEVTIQLQNASVKDLFSTIEHQTPYKFLYRDDAVENIQVTIDEFDTPLDRILNKTLEGSGFTYKILANNLIVIAPRELLQQNKISGTVTDKDGTPLPGVNVVVTGTTLGTITDVDGKYSIEVPQGAKSLSFTFVGMEKQEITIGTLTQINTTLSESAIGLEEVIVVGYGTQKKVNLTGSVSTANSKRLENRPIVSVGQGLIGVIPNLNVSIPDGDPTTSASFNIRGFESINGGSPLILVDGVPMDLERLNPNDVKSVTVLKDAAAAAVYGARAAFGVILVETKKGTIGKISVTLSTEQSIAKPIWFVETVTDPYQYVLIKNKASLRTGGAPQYDEQYVEGTRNWVENPTDENAYEVVNGVLRYYGNCDYQNKLITHFAPQNKYDITISGATEKASYYVSFGFLNKDGYLRDKENNEKFKRYNTLMKADFQVTDWLSLDEKITFNSQVSDKPHFYKRSCNINSVGRFVPINMIDFPDLPYYITPGDHEEYEQYIGMYYDNGVNWFPYLEDGGRETYATNDTWFTQGATLTPLQGLKIRSDFSYRTYLRDYQDVASKIEAIKNTSLQPVTITNGFSADDFINNQFNRSQYYVLNAYAEYELDQLKDHYVKAMVGFNQEWGRNNLIRAMASTLLTPNITDINATSGPQQTWGSKDQVSLRGAFYRLNYIYKDKYLLEVNGRYDGTSRFPKESRFGFFPSVSIGWRISKEPFMDRTSIWLDNLKIRASYGELGNQLLGSNYYPYISSMGSGMSPYIMSSSGRIPYVSAPGLVSSSLTWETVATKNLGVDFTVLKQRLDLSFDAYIRDTKNMLMNVKYPGILGTSAPKENAADLRTKGWELSVTWRDGIGQDWQYGLNFALSDNQSEITKYENPTGNFSDYYVGKKIGEIWGFETVGIFQYDEEVAAAADQSQLGSNWRAGDIHFADLNGDSKITRGSQTLDDPGDYKIIGNTTARYSFGISPDISYKNWTFNVFFQGLFRDYLPATSKWNAFYPFLSSHVEKYYITETWSEDNRDAYFPAPHVATNDLKNYQPQSRYVQNGAYIRMKNLTLNYNIPAELVKKAGLSRAQIYFSGMNLWEYTKMHKPIDPEDVFSIDQEYYFQRIFTLGAKITF